MSYCARNELLHQVQRLGGLRKYIRAHKQLFYKKIYYNFVCFRGAARGNARNHKDAIQRLKPAKHMKELDIVATLKLRLGPGEGILFLFL